MTNLLVLRAVTLAAASLSATVVACSAAPGSEETVATSSTALEVSPEPTADAGADGAVNCTGPLPQICELCPDHTRACAHWGIKDGQCAIEICPPTAPTITCSGAVAGFCVVCSDGTTACPHLASVDGLCQVVVCPAGEGVLEVGRSAEAANLR
jgi:hypothetical protein